MDNDEKIKEYEAHKTPVPSYEEYLESESHCAVYSEINQRNKEEISALKAENAQLKGLLKESRFLLGKTPYENMSQYLTFTDVMKRIDKILGED